MPRSNLLGLWISAILLASCCSDNSWTYDASSNQLRPLSEDARVLVSGLSVHQYPTGPWGYGIAVTVEGPHRAETKAFSVMGVDTAGNPIDGFRILGDGRGEMFFPFTFHAPLTVKEIVASGQPLRWPDHVFSPGYRLRPLSELEAYIQNHRHLPGLPSAEAVQRQGLPIVQTQAQLLEKIEELTLYVIQLQKEVDSLKARLAAQR